MVHRIRVPWIQALEANIVANTQKKDAILCRCVRTREEIARFFRAMPHRVSLGSSYETTQLREEFPEYGKFRKFMLSQGR